MFPRVSTLILGVLISATQFLVAQQNTVCPTILLEDERDLPENIPGETMGQKLESLLFWSQEEKERRFSMMQSIYPSIVIEKGEQSYSYEQKPNIKPQWEDNTNLASYMEKNHIAGLMVIQDNVIQLEAYGQDVNSQTLWTSYSVAKSISSLLVGVALKEGYIHSLEDPLENYISEFKDNDYGKVTVRQLLSMTSGIAWNEDYTDANSDVAQMYQRACEGKEPHIITYMKELKSIHPAGKKWNYSTGETDLVGILIQKATGKSLSDYLSEKIWKPMGMQSCAYWLADECSNLNIGGSGLSASLRDFSRLGSLMLNHGNIEGESIVAEEWLKDATSPLFEVNDQGGGYGYLWWCNPDGSYAAHGIFGQMLYINPQENLIVTQIAAWPEAGSKELSQRQEAFIQAVRNALK